MTNMAMAMATGEEEEEDIKLYLQVQTQSRHILRRDHYYEMDNEHKWYVIGLDDNAAADDDEQQPVEIQGMNRKFPPRTVSACVNSTTVYVCGGEDFKGRVIVRFNKPSDYVSPITSEVWITDTYRNDDDGLVHAGGWKEGPRMLQPRSEPCAVAVDGRIYVFGGVLWPTPNNWAEVFDIESETWSELAPSLDFLSLHVTKCVVLDLDLDVDLAVDDVDGHDKKVMNKEEKKKKRLIMAHAFVPGFLYSYDLELGVWKLFDSGFGKWARELAAVSAGGTNSTTTPLLLTIKKGLLYGYHVGRKKWFEDPVSGLEGSNVLPSQNLLSYINGFIRLVSLGRGNREFCVLWSKYSSDFLGLCVYCTKLTVYQDGPSSLAAKAEPTHTFNIDNGDALISCHAIALRRVKKRGGESHFMEEDGEEKKKIKHQQP